MSSEAEAAGEPDAPGGPDPTKYTLTEHLEELRSRIRTSVIAVLGLSIIALIFSEQLFEIMKQPVLPYLPGEKKFIVLSPLEQFVTYIKVSVLFGIVASSPVLLYQAWKFVEPGLYEKEKKLIGPFVTAGTLCFLGGALFAYFLALPMGFKYMIAIVPPDVGTQFSVERYFALTTGILVAFGGIFEMPVVMAILAMAGVVKAAGLRRFRRYFIVLAFVVGAILTPGPDPISQVLMSVPLILFYEFGVVFAAVMEKRRAASQATELMAAEPTVGER